MCKEYKDTRLKAGGEVDDRGWDGWMALPTQWTWVWVGSGSWWWTGKPGVLQSMGSQRIGHDWVTELKWIEVLHLISWSDQIRSDQLLSRARLFATPWIAARQASLSLTNSQSSLYNNINHRGADSKASSILRTCLIINPINLRLCDWTIIPYQIRNANSTHK